MPTTTAVLKRTRCSARSKRSGRRCENYCRPGAAVCWAHGGKRQRTQVAAERRELIAELLGADPRPVRLVLRDAVTVSDAIMQDVRAEVQRTGSVSPELIDRLALAAGRAAQLARVCVDVGITGEEPEIIARQHGEAVARALRVVLAPLLPRIAAGPADARRVRDWLGKAVAAALRGEEPEPPPALWRMSHAPELESREMLRRREAEAVDALMVEAEAAVAEGMAPRKDGRPGNRASSGQVIAPKTVPASPLSMDVTRDDVTPTPGDLRHGRHPVNPGRGSPWTERVG